MDNMINSTKPVKGEKVQGIGDTLTDMEKWDMGEMNKSHDKKK